MSHTIRFRLVLLDNQHGSRLAHWLIASDGAKTVLRAWDDILRIPVPLEAVSLQHLPEIYRKPMMKTTIGPIEEATGDDGAEAYLRIIALAQHARETGVIPDVQPVAPVERAEQTRVLPDTPVGSR